jgi:Xaa-Pro aminopeptidase
MEGDPMAARAGDRCAQRRDRLLRRIKRHNVDSFLVSHPTNVSYLTGFSGDSSYLWLGRDQAILITDSRFTEQIEYECPGLDVFERKAGVRMPEAVARVVRGAKARTVAFEKSHLTVEVAELLQTTSPAASWIGVAGEVEQLRAIKDADEIKQIRQAIAIAEKAFEELRRSIRPADDEKSLADRIETLVRKHGGERCAFAPIVAVGPRAAMPHAVPSDRRCDQSDFLLIDWGAKGRFYVSDLTRMLITRKISAKFARIYAVVREAHRRAIAAIRPGATGRQIDSVARRHIEQAGFGARFGHSVGHGIGLEVHEAPALGQGRDDVLKPGMVVTIEPGIYIKGWGGARLEDDVLVTHDGGEVLSSVPRALEELTIERS